VSKGRIKFTIIGGHRHLLRLRNHLILKGFELVGQGEPGADFVLVGGALPTLCNFLKPVLLLSDDSVYSDRGFDRKVRPEVPMSEDTPLLIPSTWEPTLSWTLEYMKNEQQFLCRGNTMVIRCFDVYGPDIDCGLIHEYTQALKEGKNLSLYHPGYQVRSHLHQRDFFQYFDRLLKKFLEGTVGIYNLGAEENISIKRLADSMIQLSKAEVTIEKLALPAHYRWWAYPDMTRTNAITKYKAQVSLRTGLWEMTCATKM
jgi:nucleoside-diphosphate-sugar epimerase